MAEQNRPASPEVAPDPARGYGRDDPNAEAGLGELDTNRRATPTNSPDHMDDTVKNKQPSRQLNAHEVVNERADRKPGAPPEKGA